MSTTTTTIIAANSHILFNQQQQQHREQHQLSFAGIGVSHKSSYGFGIDQYGNSVKFGKPQRNNVFMSSSSDISKTKVVGMEPITDSDHLDRILLSSQQLSQSIIIVWTASWCRKCIYLKPKLEKLGAKFDNTKIQFYCVDVNKVPGTLVKRGNVTKMPTIQIWKDGEMKEEVIGGHKASLVVEEVREMIKQYV